MALVRSSLLSDISGSIGGTTYARSRGGTYARNRTVPINPQTVAQGLVRSMLGSLSMGWNALTDAQRQAWNEWALGFNVLNRLGQSYSPSGRQAYIMLSQNLQIIGQTVPFDPPSTTIAPVLDITYLEFVGEVDAGVVSTLTVEDVGPHSGDMTYQLKLSPPLIIARGQSYRNRNRGHGQFVGDFGGAPEDISTAYESTFGGGSGVIAEVGQIINVQARCIDPTNGLSCAYIATNIVLAAA